MQKKILVFGTFDGLHEGHKNFFKQAKEYGDYLVVVVGRDSTVKRVKHRLPERDENERLQAVRDYPLVNEARLGNEGVSPYLVVKEVNPDVVCLGYDQTHFIDKLQEWIDTMGLKILIYRLKSYKPQIYHSSILNRK